MDCRYLFSQNVSLNRSHCQCIHDLLLKEREAKAWVSGFVELLTRMDCRREYNPYTVQWSCSDCEESYKRWACGNNLPEFDPKTGKLKKLCNSVCEKVISRCPVMKPLESYSAIPLFDCPDEPDDDPVNCFDPSDESPSAVTQNSTLV